VCPFPEDEHLLTVLRDVERNHFGAGLVPGVLDWKWRSLPLHAADTRPAWQPGYCWMTRSAGDAFATASLTRSGCDVDRRSSLGLAI